MNEFENSQISGFFNRNYVKYIFSIVSGSRLQKRPAVFFFVLLHISGIDRIGMETKWLQNNDRVISSA